MSERPYQPFYKPYGMSDEEYLYECRIAAEKLAEWEQEQIKEESMKPITTNDIIDELEQVYNDEEFKAILEKYPHRILVSLNFRIDGQTYVPSNKIGGNWVLNNYDGKLDEEC